VPERSLKVGKVYAANERRTSSNCKSSENSLAFDSYQSCPFGRRVVHRKIFDFMFTSFLAFTFLSLFVRPVYTHLNNIALRLDTHQTVKSGQSGKKITHPSRSRIRTRSNFSQTRFSYFHLSIYRTEVRLIFCYRLLLMSC